MFKRNKKLLSKFVGTKVSSVYLDNYIKDTGVTKLKSFRSSETEDKIYCHEASVMLKNMKSNKCPGSDDHILGLLKCF